MDRTPASSVWLAICLAGTAVLISHWQTAHAVRVTQSKGPHQFLERGDRPASSQPYRNVAALLFGVFPRKPPTPQTASWFQQKIARLCPADYLASQVATL